MEKSSDIIINGESTTTPKLNSSSSSSLKSSTRKKTPLLISRTGSEMDDFINLLHGSDPVKIELNRLENEVKDKARELGDAHAEIKGLKYSERLKEKAVEELSEELKKVEGKLKAAEVLLQNKNLEIRKINDEKKEAMAAQFAAEGTLRRVHAAQKDDEMPPIEAIIAPLEAELKMSRLEVAKLQDDNKALDRLTKSKEAALLEAERSVQIALAKASLVDDLQNKNQELVKQIDICQEENKILDRMHRQKVAEVEKLIQTVRELEEAVLSGGAAANVVREYKRKVQEMNEERKTLDRELARTKVSANRVAAVVANEWKDGNDKVMPVKQWLEERRFLQGEMQHLRDKLAVAERTARAEAQMKEKYHLRLKVLDEGFKASPKANVRSTLERSSSIGSSRRQSLGGVDTKLSSGFSSRKTTNSNTAMTLLKHAKGSSRSFDGGSRSLDRGRVISNGPGKIGARVGRDVTSGSCEQNLEGKASESTKVDQEDYVSGQLYDMLQKEVIILRKACYEKDQSLKDKDDAIEMLAKKVDTLNKAMEVEAKKMRREVAAMGKEVSAMRVSKENDTRTRRLGTSSRGSAISSHPVATRNTRNT